MPVHDAGIQTPSSTTATAGQAASVSDVDWETFVASHDDGHHEQCVEYSRQRESRGFARSRVAICRGGAVVAGCNAIIASTPVGRLGLIQRAPIVQDNCASLLTATVSSLDGLASDKSLAVLRIDTFPTQTAVHQVLLDAGYCWSAPWCGKRASLLISLRAGDADLLSQMKTKGRYNTRLAEKAGVIVETGSLNEVPEFYELHSKTAAHHGFPVFPLEYFAYLWRLFATRNRMAFFIARFNGRPVAAICNTVVGSRMYYGWGGIDRDPSCSRLMANYLLHFRAMQWAREHGCTHYDLCGDTEFKRKLGGEPILWPLPLRKFYGPFAGLRRCALETCWKRPLLRRTVDQIAWRAGCRPRLPY
ncbi:MAG: peptidoglycan bridge formation glycyltransferase FemA/FemB family protein [Phycisphaerales bacterium]|nr:peptidoglycan bridge formation glycyltransferase FemA/FemB family protein [Phycisphaerales bacterium]